MRRDPVPEKKREKQLKKIGMSLEDTEYMLRQLRIRKRCKRSVRKWSWHYNYFRDLRPQMRSRQEKLLESPFSQDGSGRNLNLVYNKNYKLPAAAEHVRELIIEKYELQKQSLQ